MTCKAPPLGLRSLLMLLPKNVISIAKKVMSLGIEMAWKGTLLGKSVLSVKIIADRAVAAIQKNATLAIAI